MFSTLSLVSKHRNALMGFAILWIMMFHLFVYVENPIIMFLLQTGYGGVDIFMFLSGLGLYFSLSKESQTLSNYYKARFIRLFPKYWIFLLLSFFISNDYSIKNIANLFLDATTIGYWILRPTKAWFIPCIVLFSALFPFYYRQFHKFCNIIPTLYIIGGGILIAVYSVIMITYFGNENRGGLLILSVARVPIFILGSVVGYAIKNVEDIRLSNKILKTFIYAFPVAVLLLVWFRKEYSDYLWTGSLHFIPFVVIAPALCIIISYILERVPKLFNDILAWFGSISLELYLAHTLIYPIVFAHRGHINFYLLCLIALFLSIISAYIFVRLYNSVYAKN